MAPELAEGPAMTSCDIYALGVLLYEMVTGHVPFTGDTPVATYWKHIREQPLPPSHFNPSLSPSIDQVILRVLEKDPGHRFQTARALCDAYKQALQVATTLYSRFEEQPYYESDVQQQQAQRIVISVPPTPPKARVRPHHGHRVLAHPWWFNRPGAAIATPTPSPLREPYAERSGATLLPPSPAEATVYEPREPVSEPVEVHPAQPRKPGHRSSSTRMFISIVAIGVLLFVGLPLSGAYYLYTTIHSHDQPTAPSAAIGQPISTPRQPQATANASVAAVTSGTPLFSDRLDSNTHGRWTEDSVHCLFTGGGYHIIVTQTNFLQPCTLLTLPIDNAAVQVDVSLLSGNDAGILLRADGERFYDFEIDRQGQFFFRRHDPGGGATYHNLIPGMPSKVIAPAGQKNTLLVIVRGDDFKLYINGIFVGEAHDSTYASGYIALAAGTLAPQTSGEGSFANLKVFKIE